ncbi:MAG TPA: hypothetical protein VFF90_06630 [Saprospiraceae bacterium]|nr:hypothetical protein [Saprospiraceae bacterium]
MQNPKFHITLRYLLLLLTFPSYSQSWIRCSIGLPPDTAVASLTKIGDVLFAGTDHAGVYKSLDGGNSWINTHLDDPIRIPLVKSMATIDTFVFAGQTNNGVARTTLNGSDWILVNNGIPKGPGYRAIFEILSVGDVLYAASNGGGVYTSPDMGEHWTVLYDNAGLNDPHALSLAANSEYLFCGTAGTNYTMPDTGVAFITSLTNGNSWSLINNGLERNGAHLEATTALAANDEVIYAGTDDVGIHRSTDNGLTWMRIPGTDQNGDIWAIKIAGFQVYYGTSYHGIFTSDDFGLSYHVNNAGLNYGNISIPDLVDDFVVSEPYIYAATSTGVYKQLLNPTSGVEEQAATSGLLNVVVFPNPFSTETNISITTELDPGPVQILITDIFGREARKFNGNIEGHFSCIKIERGDLGSGIYMYSIVKKHTLVYNGKLIIE